MDDLIFDWSCDSDEYVELPTPIAALRFVEGRVICELTDGRIVDATNLFSVEGARQ